jgi:hypothetical protein
VFGRWFLALGGRVIAMPFKVHLRRIVAQILKYKYRWHTRKSFIPIRELLLGPDRIINKGPFAGKPCYYKTGLLNTLIALRPQICLEIGTYYGGTKKNFEYYFRKYEPKGVLITADIRKYINLTSKRVRQVLVYPHVCNICKYHDITPDQLLPDFEMHFDDSVEANCEILRKELKAVGAECFDFCFVDGDHQEVSFLRDLQIARLLSRPPHYTLIDDTKDEIHECAIVYKRLMNEVNHYDFDDWPIFVGMSLIWY